MAKKHRFTKIIFTIGPATESEDALAALIRAGADVCRINMAHADHEWTRKVIRRIRKVSSEQQREIAIMMDVKGPEIRTGDVDDVLELEKDDLFDFTVGQGRGGKDDHGIYHVDVNYPALGRTLKPGDTVLVDNGLVRMVVQEVFPDRVRCRVAIPGPMGNRRHINLPGVRVDLPALTDKDRADVLVGIEEGVDFYALSFVREPKDLDDFHEFLNENNSAAKIIAKIEDQQAIHNLDGIIAASDGLMVARGDLGIECPFEDLPIIQRRAVETCIQTAKPVIIATHMLESMISSPLPTRAEVTDVSNAIREQADCVMLSGETTVGKYPLECVETILRIADRMESETYPTLRKDLVLKRPKSKMLRSAAYLASELDNAGIVVFTRSGSMAQLLSSLRPTKTPLFAFTDNKDLFRQLVLLWGIEPFYMEFDDENPEETVQSAFARIKDSGWADDGSPMVVISNATAGNSVIDTIQLRSL